MHDQRRARSPGAAPAPLHLARSAAARPPLTPATDGLRDAIVGAFSRLQAKERIRVLRRLLLPLGPLALGAIAGGAFARYIRQARSPRMRLALEHAARISAAEVLELARYAEQISPTTLQNAMRVITRSRSCAAVTPS